VENHEGPLSKTLHLSSLDSDMPTVYVLSEIGSVCLEETVTWYSVGSCCRLLVVVTVTVTVCVGTVFRTNRLIRCREHAWLRKIMLMFETYSLQERVVCLFCFLLFCLVARTLSLVHTSGSQSLSTATLLKNDVHLNDKLSLEYHSF